MSALRDEEQAPALGLSRALARFAAETRFEELPIATLATIKRCLLDSLGTMLAASTLGEGCSMFAQLAGEQGGAAQSTLLGYNAKVPALMAAFANGALAHALDFEDAHDASLTHPSAASVPAGLAVAEATSPTSGKALLAALAIGNELVCRLGAALRVAIDAYGWYPPPIFGTFGATAVAGRLYGLDEHAMLNAFSLALSQAACSAEIKHSSESWLRAVRDAFSAKAGVLSAQLAHKGVRGFEQPFEGAAGLYALYARGAYDPSSIRAGLGERYALEEISFKPWPSCRGTHAFIEAALLLARSHAIEPAAIASVRAFGHPIASILFEPVAQKQQPSTAIGAKFSIPFTVASALCHGAVTLAQFDRDALRDPRVLELAARVHFEANADAASDFEHATSGILEIETRTGQSYRHEVQVPRGHPKTPLSDAELIAKFLDCCRHARRRLDPGQASAIAERVFELERLDDVGSQLCALL